MNPEQPPPTAYPDQPVTPLQMVLSVLDIRPLKEPRGFMKALQFLFTICAFGTTSSFGTRFVLLIKCGDGKRSTTISQDIEYSFSLDKIRSTHNICDKDDLELYLRGDFSSDSEFFVAVGVLAFLYTLAALGLYCFASALYHRNVLVPIIDLGIHVLFTVLWLAASSAWASSLTYLKNATTLETIKSENKGLCEDPFTCSMREQPNYSKLDISIILGYLNTFLFASNLWFLYKETPFFKQHFPGQAAQPGMEGTMEGGQMGGQMVGGMEQPPQQLPPI